MLKEFRYKYTYNKSLLVTKDLDRVIIGVMDRVRGSKQRWALFAYYKR